MSDLLNSADQLTDYDNYPNSENKKSKKLRLESSTLNKKICNLDYDGIKSDESIIKNELEDNNLIKSEAKKTFDKNVENNFTLDRIESELIIKDELEDNVIKLDDSDSDSDIIIIENDITKTSTCSSPDVVVLENAINETVQEVNKEIEVEVHWEGPDVNIIESDPLEINKLDEEIVPPKVKRKNDEPITTSSDKDDIYQSTVRKFPKILPKIPILPTTSKLPTTPKLPTIQKLPTNSNEVTKKSKNYYIHDQGKILAKVTDQTKNDDGRIEVQPFGHLPTVASQINDLSIENLPILLIGQDGNILPATNQINGENITPGQKPTILNCQTINMEQLSNIGQNGNVLPTMVNPLNGPNIRTGQNPIILSSPTKNEELLGIGQNLYNTFPNQNTITGQGPIILANQINIGQKNSQIGVQNSTTGSNPIILSNQMEYSGPFLNFGQNINVLPTMTGQNTGQKSILLASQMGQNLGSQSLVALGQNNLPNEQRPFIIIDQNMHLPTVTNQIYNQNQPLILIEQSSLPTVTNQNSISNQSNVSTNVKLPTVTNQINKKKNNKVFLSDEEIQKIFTKAQQQMAFIKAQHPFGKSGLTMENVEKYYEWVRKQFYVSEDIIPNVCDICKETFSSSRTLINHFNKLHVVLDDSYSGDNRNSSTFCDKTI